MRYGQAIRLRGAGIGQAIMKRLVALADRARTESRKVPAWATAWWGTYVPIALVALLGVTVTWHAFREVTSWERQRVQNAFYAAARDRVLVVRREIEYNLGVVLDVGSFIETSRRIERREFRRFVGPAVKRYGSIESLEWIPQVTGAERVAFEKAARRSFPRFQMNERGPGGDLVRAGARPVHFPVLYVQPYQLNKERLGLDLAADGATLADLLQTGHMGQMRVSPRVPLERGGGREFGFVARLPVYDQEDSDQEEDALIEIVEDRPLMLRGFAAGVFRIGVIVERALDNLSPSGIDLVLYDVSGEDRRQYLYHHGSRLRAAKPDSQPRDDGKARDGWEFVQAFSVMDRQWEAVGNSIAGQFQPDPWRGRAVLAGGWSFTALLTIYLSTLVGRAAKVRRLVAKRTAQLLEANEALNTEIGERMNAEKELQALNETLEHRVAERTAESERHVKELEQFAYVTSHDLKAPLRGIANLAAWLEEDLQGKLTDDTREQLQLLRDRVQRMNALIEGLLKYSRIGRTGVSLETVDVAELLAEVIDSLSPPPGFVVDVAPDMPTLHTDRLQLSQVFSNLIGNAIKHCRGEEGHVWVTAGETREGGYEFTVADNGPGIAPEYHGKVFQMFQTLQTTDFGSNTGIGLALVRKIVQEHGGSITLDSAEGRGARFRFTWPKDG